MNDSLNGKYQLIDTGSELKDIVKAFEGAKRIAVDLEADSMFHFKEKVCLIQMATEEITVVIDPLVIEDLSVLKPLFKDPTVQKIFHGSDYDVRSLHRDFDIEINNLFDTELAGRFLGVRETGLSSVLHSRFDVKLDKKYQKKDWSQRPLPGGMVDYAAGDVFYLLPLAEIFERELAEKGRSAWVEEECELLSRVRQACTDGEPLFMKFKGAGRLDGRNLAVLEALLGFRMEVAEKRDKPLFKVFGTASLMKLVTAKPTTMARLKALKAISPRQISMYGTQLIERITAALDTPRSDLPVYPRKRAPRLNPRVPARIKTFKEWRDREAEKLGLDPALLFNKFQMTTISVKNPRGLADVESISELKGWQKNEFGGDIVNVFSTCN